MVSTDLWTIWNTSQASLDLQGLQEKMDLLDLQVKKVTTDGQARRVREETEVCQVKWAPWVFLDPWENQDPMALMALQGCQDKLVQWAQWVRRVNVVILVQWATMVLRARKVTKATRVEGVDQDQKGPQDAWWVLMASLYPIVRP